MWFEMKLPDQVGLRWDGIDGVVVLDPQQTMPGPLVLWLDADQVRVFASVIKRAVEAPEATDLSHKSNEMFEIWK